MNFNKIIFILLSISFLYSCADYKIKTDREDLIDELVDVHKFLWGLMATWEITPEEFINQFKKKSAIVEQRWTDEHDSN